MYLFVNNMADPDAKVAADDILPVQIERRFNKLSTFHCTQLIPSPFLSVFLHRFVYSKHKSTLQSFSPNFSFENIKIISIFGYKSYKWS